MNCGYTYNGILPSYKKELLFHTTAWGNLRHVILNEGSHVYEKIHTISSQSSRTSVVHGRTVTRCKGGMVVLARKDPERTFWGDRRILNIDLDDGCPDRYKTHQAISLGCVHLIFVCYTLKIDSRFSSAMNTLNKLSGHQCSHFQEPEKPKRLCHPLHRLSLVACTGIACLSDSRELQPFSRWWSYFCPVMRYRKNTVTSPHSGFYNVVTGSL